MAKKKLTVKKRAEFSFSKVLGALKWVAMSDVTIYAITEFLNVSEGLQIPTRVVLLLRIVLNVLVFATAKFVEGEDK